MLWFGFRSLRGGRRSLLLSLWFFAACRVGAQEPAPAVPGLPEELLPGLAPILKTALERSPELIRRSIDVTAAEGRRYVGRSAMLPSLNAWARYTVNNEEVVSGNGNGNDSSGFFYDVTLNQPVYHWGALKAQAERERIGLKITEAQYKEAYRSLALLLRRLYLDLMARKSSLGAMRAQLALEKATQEREEAKVKAGFASPGVASLAQLTVEQRQLDLDRAQADFDYAKRTFMRTAGLTEFSDAAIPEAVARPPLAGPAADTLLQAYYQGGAEQTFQAQSLSLGVQQSEKDYLIAARRLYPKFGLFAGYNVRSETQADANGLNQVSVASRNYGLKLDWWIFDGLATKGYKLSALAARRNNERALENHLAENRDAAQHQHRQLGFAARALDLGERGLGGAEAALARAREDAAAGRVSELEVDRLQQALIAARAAILPQRADYLMRWAEFVSLVGADPAMKNIPARYAR